MRRMDRLSACVEVLRSRWLASSINCCFPRLPAQSEQDLSGASGRGHAATQTDREKHWKNIGKYATNSLRLSLPRTLILNLGAPNPNVLIVLHSGWQKVAILLHEPRVERASPRDEPSRVDRTLEHLPTLEDSSARADVSQAFDHWS